MKNIRSCHSVDKDNPLVKSMLEHMSKRGLEAKRGKKIMRDMRDGINKAIELHEENARIHGWIKLSAYEKGLIEHGYIQCSLQIGHDIVSKGESFMVGLQEMVLRDDLPLRINNFIKEVGENNKAHGFRDSDLKPTDFIALIHSEVSELLEEFRAGHDAKEIYYRKDGKPEGIPSELADVVIRCFDMADFYGIDLESAILEKHEFNKTRPYKHGKEF